jgi:hypothetical protein
MKEVIKKLKEMKMPDEQICHILSISEKELSNLIEE